MTLSKTSKKTGIKWVWFGGHGIHGYAGRKEIAFFNSGNFAYDGMTPEEARRALNNIADKSPEYQADYAADENEEHKIMSGYYKKAIKRDKYEK